MNDPAKNSFVELSTSFIDINTENETDEYVVYDKTLSMKSYTGRFPDWGSSDDALPQFLYMKFLSKLPGKDRFVAVYGHYPVIRICNSEGKPIREVYTYTDSFFGGISNVFYCCRPVANEDCILALSQGGVPNSDHPELHMFDWKGNLLKTFVFDRPVDNFSVSFDYGKIVAYSSSSPYLLYCADICFN